jgi:hypothetical protein
MRMDYVLASMCTTVLYITDPRLAEAVVTWKDIVLCKNLGLQRVFLEGDAL